MLAFYHNTYYNIYRTKLRNLIRTSEVNYFKSKFDNSCGNIKKAWNVINAVRCKNKTAQFPRFIDINSPIITNRRQLCQEFNKYFVNLANNLNISKYQDTPSPYHSCYLRNSVKSSIFLASIHDEEVNDVILNLDNHKSNDISPKLLKSLSGTFSRILSYFFNLCISSGVFPDELKVGKIVPL